MTLLMGSRTIKWVTASVLLMYPSALAAFIPPTIGVHVVSENVDAQATSRAVVELLASYNNFQWGQSEIQMSAARACLKGEDATRCMRAVVRQSAVNPQAPTVLIFAQPAGEGRIGWTCIGAGSVPMRPVDQSITIDVGALVVGASGPRSAAQRRALECIWAAAAEAGGVISIL